MFDMEVRHGSLLPASPYGRCIREFDKLHFPQLGDVILNKALFEQDYFIHPIRLVDI